MKVYGAPESISKPSWPQPFNHKQYDENCKAYRAEIVTWLQGLGYTGPLTGRIVAFGVADGSAQYLFADGGRKSFLVHLQEVDGYQYRDVEFLPKAEIIRRLQKREGDPGYVPPLFGSSAL
jgi:hypothetical protein